MRDDNIKRQPHWWTLVLIGAFVGGCTGLWVGGGTAFAFCVVTVLIGLNPPLIMVYWSAYYGAVAFSIAGAFLGAAWPLLRGRRWRQTMPLRMLTMAGVGLTVLLLFLWPTVGLLVVCSLLVLPVIIAALFGADRYFRAIS